MYTKIISSFYFFLFLSFGLNGQNIENWIDASQTIPVEKIYLHTDREYYFPGETIWFKSYLTDSNSGKLIPGTENVYLNLIDDNGAVVLKKLQLSVNGLAHGNIDLADTLNPGDYILQAFTNYLLNIGEEAFFRQPIKIHNLSVSSSTAKRNQPQTDDNQQVADISFLPEGGMLLENTSNVIAFKAIGKNGYSANANGMILDESGETVTNFKTDYLGMGLFFLTPETGKSYTAKINGFPSFSYSFDSLTVSDGIKIQLVNHTSTEFIVNIKSNSTSFQNGNFYLVNMHRGEVLFYRPIKIESQNQVLKFDNQMLRGGINRLVLLDNNLTPLSERLLFSRDYQLDSLNVSTNSATYEQRSEVLLNITKNDSIKKYLSVTVAHKNAYPEKGNSCNILSSFLINSELKGFSGPSADFFTNSEIPSDTKLRLLMLTHGWSSYFWNSVPTTAPPDNYGADTGINLKGKAWNRFTEKPLENGEITLVIEKDNEMAFLTQQTNENGEFTFPGLLFNDTAKILVQAKNEKGRQNTEILLEPVIKSVRLNNADLHITSEIPATSNDLMYEKSLAAKQKEKDRRLAKRKNRVSAEKPFLQEPNDGRFRIYDNPDHIIEVPENETTAGNILEFLSGKVAGVDVNSKQVRIRGTSHFEESSMPLFLIDGVPLSPVTDQNLPDEIRNAKDVNAAADEYVLETVNSIPLRDIEKVEILKSPQNLAAFGIEGANGVIAIYTRRGDNTPTNDLAKGIIWQKIVGYASARNFYSPSYLPKDKKAEKPDFRTTLYWDAEAEMEDEKYERTFFTSDQTGDYLIIVEGISEDGTLCYGINRFRVKSSDKE